MRGSIRLLVYELLFLKQWKRWVLVDGLSGALAGGGAAWANKKIAVKDCEWIMNQNISINGQHSELRIRNKNGRYSPARTYPRSADPKRSKG